MGKSRTIDELEIIAKDTLNDLNKKYHLKINEMDILVNLMKTIHTSVMIANFVLTKGDQFEELNGEH